MLYEAPPFSAGLFSLTARLRSDKTTYGSRAGCTPGGPSSFLASYPSPAIMKDLNAQHQGDLLQLVSFVIQGEEFGVDILKVQEIIRPLDITRVPNAPAFVEGVINLRGRIIPIVDLRARFGLPPRERDKDTRIVVVELDEQVTGFMMDAVKEVIRVDRNVIEPPPELAIGVDTDYLKGVAKLDDRLLILLDLEEVLSDEELHAVSAASDAAPKAAEPVAA